MSTIYNRRRGAKANRPRNMRGCRYVKEEENADGMVYTRCVRVAPVNRYCSDHQTTKKETA